MANEFGARNAAMKKRLQPPEEGTPASGLKGKSFGARPLKPKPPVGNKPMLGKGGGKSFPPPRTY